MTEAERRRLTAELVAQWLEKLRVYALTDLSIEELLRLQVEAALIIDAIAAELDHRKVSP